MLKVTEILIFKVEKEDGGGRNEERERQKSV